MVVGFAHPACQALGEHLAVSAALLIAVNFNLSDVPSAQDNLSKLLSALSA